MSTLQNWIWNGIELSLPDEWEMLQFSRNPETGRCAFADRYQFRFELDWMRVDAPPDMERMANDYRAKLQDDGLESVTKTGHGQWLGASGLEKGVPISRYGAFLPGRAYILEAVFIWAKGERATPAFEGRILDSVKVPSPAPDGRQKWRSFGMDWTTACDLSFDTCVVSPGLAEATFNNRKRRVTQRFARRGMLSYWLKADVRQWLEAQIPKEYKVVSTESATEEGHEVWRLEAQRSPSVLVDWLHGRRTIQAAAWICPEDGRLYFVASHAHQGKGEWPFATLSCCKKLEVKV